jgi:hypothetical protein
MAIAHPFRLSGNFNLNGTAKAFPIVCCLVAPYRHARLSAMKLAGDPNNPFRIPDAATADELRAEVMRHIARLSDAGILDLQALPSLKGPVSN